MYISISGSFINENQLVPLTNGVKHILTLVQIFLT